MVQEPYRDYQRENEEKEYFQNLYDKPDLRYYNLDERGLEGLLTHIVTSKFKRPVTGHDAIDKLIAKAKTKDDFRFGQYGDIKTNLIESLFKSGSNVEDLLKVDVSGKLGKNKQWDYSLGAGKDNYRFGISKLF